MKESHVKKFSPYKYVLFTDREPSKIRKPGDDGHVESMSDVVEEWNEAGLLAPEPKEVWLCERCRKWMDRESEYENICTLWTNGVSQHGRCGGRLQKAVVDD